MRKPKPKKVCRYCGQPLDRRRICPNQTSSARFPNGRKCSDQ